MSTQEEKGWFARLQKKLASQPRCTPEEREAFAAERKASEGTMWEWAQMQDNGDIAIRVTQHGMGGTHGIGDYVVSSNDESYDKCRTEYGLDQPGDTRHITKRWKNDEWVLEKTEKTNASLASPQQSTEGKHSQAS